MTEIQPQIVYTPQGMLDIRTDLLDESKLQDEQLELLGNLAERSGTTYDEDGTLHVDVRRSLGTNFGYARDGAINYFLHDLGKVMTSIPDSGTDRVLYTPRLSESKLTVAVYPQLQRWLNSQTDLGERVARETLLAMALPLGHEQETFAKNDFRIYDRHAQAGSFRLAMSTDEFFVAASNGKPTTDDTVDWNTVSLTTLGSCTSIGMNAQPHHGVMGGSNYLGGRLYEMKASNIDFPQQTLSLLLGMGTLAYHAAAYAGREQVLFDVRRTGVA
jgi:hypothetical protein